MTYSSNDGWDHVRVDDKTLKLGDNVVQIADVTGVSSSPNVPYLAFMVVGALAFYGASYYFYQSGPRWLLLLTVPVSLITTFGLFKAFNDGLHVVKVATKTGLMVKADIVSRRSVAAILDAVR